jgi:L-rhamnose mutarotase
MIIKVRPEKLDEYKRLHAEVWSEVLEAIADCNISNYSIYHRDGLLFGYFEYVGEDFESDMATMAQNKAIRDWWALTDPCQGPLETAVPGEWWSKMEEVFHC